MSWQDTFGGIRLNLINFNRVLFHYSILSILLVLIGFPLLFYIWGSVWSVEPGLTGHFTIEGYERIFAPDVYSVIGNTLILTVVGTSTAMIIGVSAVIFVLKTDFPGKSVVPAALFIHYLLPSSVLAIAWRFYGSPQGILNSLLMNLPFISSPPIYIYGIWAIAFVAGSNYAGLVYLLTSGPIRTLPASYEEAGVAIGAPNIKIISKITLGLALPSLSIAVLIISTRMLQAFGLPLILGSRDQTYVISTYMYAAINSFPPSFSFASALGMLILSTALIGLYLQRSLIGLGEKFETITGGETQNSWTFNLGKYKVIISAVFMILVIFVYILPIVVLFMASISQSVIGMDFLNPSITLEHWTNLLMGGRANRFYGTTYNTLFICGLGALLGMALSVHASYIITKTESKVGVVLDYLTLTPLGIPSIVIGLAFLWIAIAYNPFGLSGTVWIIIIALVTKFIIYGVRAANSSFYSVDSKLEEAAKAEGASMLRTFKSIYLPLIRPGLVAGFLILFIDFMKVLTIPLLLTTDAGNEVLAVLMWQYLSQGELQLSAAVSISIMVIIAILYSAAIYFDIDMEI